MRKIMLASVLLLELVSSCKKEAVGTLMKISSHTMKCQGEMEMNCLLVQMGKDIDTKNWTYFYDSIEGFKYEEGYFYLLKVREDRIANPPADGSSIKYTLLDLISKTKAEK